MEKYIINSNTLLIMPKNNYTKIIEKKSVINILSTPKKIIDESCKYYGSSLQGRNDSTSYLIGTKYKNPILISEIKQIIFFPTISCNKNECIWINLNAIIKYSFNNNILEIILINGEKININISLKSFSNQLFKATRLESIFKTQNI